MEKFTSSKTATLLKVTLLHGCFSRYLNYTNGTKSRKTSRFKHLANRSRIQLELLGKLWLIHFLYLEIYLHPKKTGNIQVNQTRWRS